MVSPVNRIGEVLVDTYRIERLLAEGGMGSVYEARHLRLPKRFAVKFLNLNLISNLEAQARFRREAEVIATLDHPGVVTLLDYNLTDDGVPFIVLEYLDGEHLGRRIAAEGRLSLAETLRILAPVSAALGAAHARDIIHRDLKPENIVLCKDDQVKVVDFGIAKFRDGQELTAMNTILGTVPYMAPEQLFGTEVSPRTDQFAMAVIVYEMLTGEMAFGGQQSVPEVAARVAHYQPPEVPGVSQAVNAVLFQAMAKDPAARFPTMKAFLVAMQEAAARTDEALPAGLDLAALVEGLPPLQGEATTVMQVAPAPPERAPLPAPSIPEGERFTYGEERLRPSITDDTGSAVLPEQRAALPVPAPPEVPPLVVLPAPEPPADLRLTQPPRVDWNAAAPPSLAPSPHFARPGATTKMVPVLAEPSPAGAGRATTATTRRPAEPTGPSGIVPPQPSASSREITLKLGRRATGVWVGVAAVLAVLLALAAWIVTRKG